MQNHFIQEEMKEIWKEIVEEIVVEIVKEIKIKYYYEQKNLIIP